MLATPLTVCLVVLGRHVERLAFLDVMFGDRPALSSAEIFYQRMLAGYPTEAAEKAEEFLKERSLSSYYDDVALKGLQLAQADLDRDALDQSRLMLNPRHGCGICRTTFQIRTIMSQRRKGSTSDAEAAAAIETASSEPVYADLPILKKDELAAEWQGEKPVLCVAGRTALDEAAAIMFAHLCNVHGLAAASRRARKLCRRTTSFEWRPTASLSFASHTSMQQIRRKSGMRSVAFAGSCRARG